eukprot:1157308-Pelagomonas_calceolata.AAC.4
MHLQFDQSSKTCVDRAECSCCYMFLLPHCFTPSSPAPALLLLPFLLMRTLWCARHISPPTDVPQAGCGVLLQPSLRLVLHTHHTQRSG